jgi:hypothetical protein
MLPDAQVVGGDEDERRDATGPRGAVLGWEPMTRKLNGTESVLFSYIS